MSGLHGHTLANSQVTSYLLDNLVMRISQIPPTCSVVLNFLAERREEVLRRKQSANVILLQSDNERLITDKMLTPFKLLLQYQYPFHK